MTDPIDQSERIAAHVQAIAQTPEYIALKARLDLMRAQPACEVYPLDVVLDHPDPANDTGDKP